MSISTPTQVMICQNRTCRKQGAAKVLKAFQEREIPGVAIAPSGCLGECGQGPMVLTLPDQVWYDRVRPEEVPAIVERHLRDGQPIEKMIYRVGDGYTIADRN
ncbi:MAG: (2Fe-2S) ferredoxin domain-containing protein [Limnospira sp.]